MAVIYDRVEVPLSTTQCCGCEATLLWYFVIGSPYPAKVFINNIVPCNEHKQVDTHFDTMFEAALAGLLEEAKQAKFGYRCLDNEKAAC